MVNTSIRYWLALKYVPRLSIEKKLNLINHIGLEALFTKPISLTSFGLTAKQIAAIINPNWLKIDNIIESSKKLECTLLGYDDEYYPNQLKEIYDPPLVLFVLGNIDLLSDFQIAVVGSRSATVNGKNNTQYFSQTLVEHNIVVTSGLAIGIDGYAHRTTLDAGGKTIAVVATGLDIIYPSRHKTLVHNILDNGGAIVSEFTPGTLAKPGHFPKRNRIISGLSKGVLVVEAELKSGSLITARVALEQNREVFAVPGNINVSSYKGCHNLIKQGAKLVDDIADIINEFDVGVLPTTLTLASRWPDEVIKSTIKSGSPDALAQNEKENNTDKSLFIDSLLASVGDDITPIDVIVMRSGLSTSDVLNRLTMLELKGLVLAVPGGYQRLSER